MNRFLVGAASALLLLSACDNGGASRTLGVTATGIVRARVFLDANGSGTLDAPETGLPGVRVALLPAGGGDTIVRALTDGDGLARLSGVPVGAYRLAVDSASLGDSLRVLAAGAITLLVAPGDSVAPLAPVGYPVRTVAEVRASALGARVLVKGVALHALGAFSDTTLHVADGTGALRATRLRPLLGGVAAGDSVVLRGRVGIRDGRVVLDDVTALVVGPTLLPPAPTLSSAAAGTAGTAAVNDAALVRVLNALVSDTATVLGNRVLTVSDGSGPLSVVLDRAADAAFRPPLPPGLYVPGVRFDLVGVLVPTGTGSWRLKPRSSLDLTPR